jgi:hypothetical protein
MVCGRGVRRVMIAGAVIGQVMLDVAPPTQRESA